LVVSGLTVLTFLQQLNFGKVFEEFNRNVISDLQQNQQTAFTAANTGDYGAYWIDFGPCKCRNNFIFRKNNWTSVTNHSLGNIDIAETHKSTVVRYGSG